MSEPGETVRRAIIAATLAQLTGDDPAVLIQPVCPRCNEGPTLALYRQCFCGNDDCDVMTWDPTKDPAYFEAHAQEIRWTDRSGEGERG